MKQLSIPIPDIIGWIKKAIKESRERRKAEKERQERMRLKPYDPALFNKLTGQVEYLLEQHAKEVGERVAVVDLVTSMKEEFRSLRSMLVEEQGNIMKLVTDAISKTEKALTLSERRIIDMEVKFDQDRFDWKNELPGPVKKEIKTLQNQFDSQDETLRGELRKTEERIAGSIGSISEHLGKINSSNIAILRKEHADRMTEVLKSMTDVRQMVDKVMLSSVQSATTKETVAGFNALITDTSKRVATIMEMMTKAEMRMDQGMALMQGRVNELAIRLDAASIAIPPGETLPTAAIARVLSMEQEATTA